MSLILSMIAALLMNGAIMNSGQEARLREAEVTNDEAAARIIYDEIENTIQ